MEGYMLFKENTQERQVKENLPLCERDGMQRALSVHEVTGALWVKIKDQYG